MMQWNVFVVDAPTGKTCYLVPDEVVFRIGLPYPLIVGELLDAVAKGLTNVMRECQPDGSEMSSKYR